jgi:hypothetical protein
MQICHFYQWSLDELRSLSRSEYEAAVQYMKEASKEKG